MLLIALLTSFAVPGLALLARPPRGLGNGNVNVKRQQASLQDSLFPTSETYLAGFTTAPSSEVQVAGVTGIDFSDPALGVTDLEPGTNGHDLVSLQGKQCWQANFPTGSYTYTTSDGQSQSALRGGFDLLLDGPEEFSAILADGAFGVMFGYSVFFSEDFEWAEGGVLPGAYGGLCSATQQCSGDVENVRDNCFDFNLRWSGDGTGEVYTHLPLNLQNTASQASVGPTSLSSKDADFGYSVGRGSFQFTAQRWYTIAQRIILNRVGASDGRMDLWVDGEVVMSLKNISMRTSHDAVIKGMHFDTYFTGNTTSAASPANQGAYFSDISGAIIKSTGFY